MFNYLIEKISSSSLQKYPFEHIYIEGFFNEDQFCKIINSKQINLPNFKNTKELCNFLLKNGFEPIDFPGCTTNINDYCKWVEGFSNKYINVDTAEGFGMAFRLKIGKDEILTQLNNFINSDEFKKILCKKFEININDVFSDVGIQKYLNGYEISPHADVRNKALTFMVNINPGISSEKENFHMHFMRFIDNKKYIYDFWKYNSQFDRSWVPWNWCETLKQQKVNNSIVIFKPSHKTLHAIKAKYNHLITQRTQLYGNLWYKEYSSEYKWSGSKLPQIPWQGLLIDESRGTKHIKNKRSNSKFDLKRNIKKIFFKK